MLVYWMVDTSVSVHPFQVGHITTIIKAQTAIILLGLVGAHYRFIYVNEGVNGRISDGGVFSVYLLSQKMWDGSYVYQNLSVYQA
nr:unnamed protein product [Callosobruchus analis]